MAKAYVALRDDKFTRAIKAGRGKTGSGDVSRNFTDKVDKYNVRRPLHGMSTPEDSYASMTVVTPGGAHLKVLKNSSLTKAEGDSSISSSYTTNFIVQSINESKAEKQQIVQTFGDDYVYFYGQQPTMLQVQAVLPESEEFMYAQEFWTNYGSALRGTQLVLKNARMYFTVAGQVFEGYITNASTSKRADSPRVVNLNFSIYVTNSYYLQTLSNTNSYSPRTNGGSAETKHHSEVRAGDYVRIKGISPNELKYMNSPNDPPNISKLYAIAENIGFGKFADDLPLNTKVPVPVKDPIEDPVRPSAPTTNAIGPDSPFTGANGQHLSVESPHPLIQALKTKSLSTEEGDVSVLQTLSTALSIAAGGLILAGATKALHDDYRSFVVGGGRNGIGGYAYNRIVQPAVGAVVGAGESALNAGDALFNAGYNVIRNPQSSGVNGVFSTSSRSSGTESIDSIVLDI